MRAKSTLGYFGVLLRGIQLLIAERPLSGLRASMIATHLVRFRQFYDMQPDLNISPVSFAVSRQEPQPLTVHEKQID